jgi:hypothetical protein
MKKIFRLLLGIALLPVSLSVFGQNDFFKISGFVNYEAFYDSRLYKTLREEEIMLLPLPVQLDSLGNDINDHGETSMLTFHSRLHGDITGPSALGAEITGAFEVDFLGTGESMVNLIRLRHAWFKLKWQKTELLFGQYWHPLFVPECYPHAITWGGGLPLYPLSRNPQIRFTYKPYDKLLINVALLAQRDFANAGPDGNSGKYMKYALKPDAELQIMAGDNNHLLVGATVGYRTIVPRIVSTKGYAVKESLGAFNANFFICGKNQKIDWRAGGIYGDNMSNFVMMGGYGVLGVINNVTGEQQYMNSRTTSIWLDADYALPFNLYLGFYGGYSKNHGSDKMAEIQPFTYGLYNNVHDFYRIAPRFYFKNNGLRFALEATYTNASYGTLQNDMSVSNLSSIGGTRWLFSASKFF